MKTSQLSKKRHVGETLRSEGFSLYLLWLIWVAWIPFFIPVLTELFHSNPPLQQLIITLAGVVVFFTIYLTSSWLDARYLTSSPSLSTAVPLRVWLTIASLSALGGALIIFNGGNGWLGLFYYISGYLGARLKATHTILAVSGLALLALSTKFFTHNDWNLVGQALLFIIVIGTIITCIGQVLRINQKLRLAREEIAQLAITTERLRIARDLHDLLGHNLALITLKSELAGRLITNQPGRAAQEMKDVEEVARTTLQEVREAVSSYRQPSLVSELQAAQDILSAAGINYRFESEEELIKSLPPAIEAALSWVVREGVTNVIKHSRARQCFLRFKLDSQSIFIEIVDDGVVAPGETGHQGNGLSGLVERLAVLGGKLEAAPASEGGFRLVVQVPLTRQENNPQITEQTALATLQTTPGANARS